MNLWTVLGVALAVYAIRMAGPDDFADEYHQERAAAYVMDALQNGNWISQYGVYGEVSSKPPMLTWLAALASLPFGQANWFTMTLPGALATIGLAALIFGAGARVFGRTAGFYGAIVYLLSPIGAKQMVLARIDGLFSFTIAVTALLGFRAWQTGRGWTWFWLAGAVATLTKGPLGVVLAAVGLLAVFWERRGGFTSPVKGNHLPGVILYFAICGGWLLLGYLGFGQSLIDVVLGRELIGQVVKDSRTTGPFTQAYLPTLMFLSRYIPWAPLTCVGIWQAFKRPCPEAQARRFERFLCCWFLGGLLIFSCAAHQRPDLIFPLIPAAALLAGRAIAKWSQALPRVERWFVPAAAAATLAGLLFYYVFAIQSRPRVQRTKAVKELAAMVKAADVRVRHMQSPYALQLYLNTKERPLKVWTAGNLLARPAPVFIATTRPELIRNESATNVYVLYRWLGPRKETLELLSNRPRLGRD